MVNPRRDCEPVPDEHTRDRILLRSFPVADIVRLVRQGRWESRGGNDYEVRLAKWRAKVKLGNCTIEIKTIHRD